MDAGDVVTGDFPSRLALEEEEEQMQEVAEHYSDPPLILLQESLRDVVDRSGVERLIFAVGRGTCILLRHACSCEEVVGTVTLPPLGAPPGTALYTTRSKEASLRACSSLASSCSTIVCLCPDSIPDEQSRAWAHAVLGTLQPQQVLVLSTLPAQDFRGGGDPSGDALVFAVQAAAGSGPAVGLQDLPAGNMLAGVAAAVVQYCQLRCVWCLCVAAIQWSQVPDAALLKGLSHAATQAVKWMGCDTTDVFHFEQPSVISAACRELDSVYISSAVASMYS